MQSGIMLNCEGYYIMTPTILEEDFDNFSGNVRRVLFDKIIFA